jgi:predicted HTH transcriptional regulator
MKVVDTILTQLADLIRLGQFTDLETEGLELKPVPADGGEWKQRHKSINAFLNARGGIMILGVREEGTGPSRRYVFTGWKAHAESNVKDIPKLFTDRKGVVQDLSDCFPPMELRDFLTGRVAVLYVDELASDRKFVFYKGTAYKRILTGDHKILDPEVEAQEEFKEEAVHARELQPVPGLSEANLDLAKLNQFIFQLNQPVPVETMKADLAQARPFLERRCFIKEGAVTVLGALVCAQHPGDCLGFRSHVHGYVDVPPRSQDAGESQVVQDKQDFVDNVLQLMESGLGYFLRNIQVGVSVKEGGTSQPQYPVTLLRETVNNALAHRDYSINRQVILAIKPGQHIAIRNPGTFRKRLLMEAVDPPIPVRRILPEAKPRNPKLADVLRVYRKWEGRGIGMATLVSLCLENQMDLPYYRLFSEEVCLFLCAGRLLDEPMERLFHSFNGYLEQRLQGSQPTDEQKRVLAYLIKSEWANEKLGYTILLTPDNNHFAALLALERSGLISKHPISTPSYPVYVADRILMSRGHVAELRQIFSAAFDALDPFLKSVLGIVYRFNNYHKARLVSAKQASFVLWYEGGGTSGGIEQFDAFYRRVRYAFNKLLKGDFVIKAQGTRGYRLNTNSKVTPVQSEMIASGHSRKNSFL